MLWIQYEAESEIEELDVKNVLKNIGELISPYPVAAFDKSNFGFRLISWEENCQETLEPLPAEMSNSGSYVCQTYTGSANDNCASQLTTSTTFGPFHSEMAVIPADMCTKLSDVPLPSAGPSRWKSRNAPRVALRQHANDDEHDDNPLHDEDHDLNNDDNDSNPNNNNQNTRSGRENEQEPENSETDEVPEEDPREPTKPATMRKGGTFWGKTNLYIEDGGARSRLHELDISFDLEIQPTRFNNGDVDCHISLHRVVVKVSPVIQGPNMTIEREDPTLLYLRNSRVSIAMGPNGGSCMDIAQWPLAPSFLERCTSSRTVANQLSVELAAKPKVAWKGGIERMSTEDLLPLMSGVKPEYIGCGPTTGDVRWVYNVLNPFQTRLELSERIGSIHEATLRFNDTNDADVPTTFAVAVDAIYKPEAGFRWKRFQSILRPKARFFGDVRIAHVKMILKADIGQKDGDWFAFPTDSKSGCNLSMDLVFLSSQGLCGLLTQGGSPESTASLNSSGSG